MANGPHKCGDGPDACITRHFLHYVLEKGKNNIDYGGYYSSVDCRAMTPAGTNDYCDRQVAAVRARHETVNLRLKIILCKSFRNPLEKHGIVLKSISNIAQLTISNVDNSFEVEHSEQDQFFYMLISELSE